MTADDMPNRAMHTIASMWDATASATVFGFMEEGSPEALIYGLDDSGGLHNRYNTNCEHSHLVCMDSYTLFGHIVDH
jgi:hypothetical protein